MMRLARLTFLFSILTGCQVFAQGLVMDSSGDSMLSGNYYFREVIYDSSGGDAYTLFGTISFTGTGSYTMTATENDIGQGEQNAGTVPGSYAIGAGGFGYITSALFSGVQIRGMVSNGVFIGSATEGGFNDLFIAGQIPPSTPTASSFSGTYSMAYLNYSSPLDGAPYDAQFTMNPNGAGSVSLANISGYYVTTNTTTGAGATAAVSQNGATVKYTVSNGAVVLNFPSLSTGTSTELLSGGTGGNYLYFSPDGNFVFGGSAGATNLQADMFIGVKTGGASPLLSSPLYYNAGAFLPVSTGGYDIDTYYGSISLNSGVDILHSRLFSAGLGSSFDSVTTGTAPTTAGATYSDPFFNYTIGSGGNYRIGFGTAASPGIDIAVAPQCTDPQFCFSGSGAFLNPAQVVNAASYAPFTQGLSPGELLVLRGTDLAPNATIGSADIAQSANFPTTLNGVQVLIDEIPAPLYYVSAKQIAAIVPYEVTQYPANFANVQVNNNGQLSHTISEFLGVGTPGVFTNPADGLGLAAAEHADGTLITENSPAQPGESIAVYLTGLGQVIPPIQDGTPGISSAPYNQTFNAIYAAIDGPTSSTQASVLYAGLAPTLTGLYQVNLTVPSGVTAGDNYLEIDVLDSNGNPLSTSEEAIIPIGSGGTPGVSPVRPEIENGQTYKANRSKIGKPLKTHVAIKAIQP
jgi:uncharacterized protein (TIGR03437 family)